MSFKAKLNVGGEEFNVLSCTYDLDQETDATGRPSSITKGGKIHITIESTDSTMFFEWMCNSFERKDGKVTFFKRDSEAELKSIEFTEAYLVRYAEDFSAFNNEPLKETFTLSSREISVGNGVHVNEWV